MDSRNFRLIIAFCLLALSALAEEDTHSQTIQFCRQDDALSLDFCMAATPYQNATFASTDLYITITRNQSSIDGWLGVGIGPSMTGSLMFIMHVKTSIRKGIGHHQPTELSAMDLADYPDIRVLRSAYSDQQPPSSATEQQAKPRTATANIVIYSFPLWPSTSIDPASPSQPWIWAHNPTQRVTAHDGLGMHSHDKGVGYGFFWTDFKTALSTAVASPSPPPFPTPDVFRPSHLSTEKAPAIYRLGGPQIRNWMFHLHGLLASLATLLLYPLGALLLRTSDPRAFNFHWTTQAFASVLLGLGAMLGWILSRRIELVHQVVGLVVVGCVVAQVVLGWRHHVGFLRRGGKGGPGWMGRVHVWMGRGLLATGWVNVLLGLKARSYGFLTFVAVGILILVEAGVMIRVLGFRRGATSSSSFKTKGLGITGARQRGAAESGGDGLGEEYFELVGHDDDLAEEEEDDDVDENYDEDGRLKADVEWEEERLREGRKGERAGIGEEGETARKLKRLDIV
jgi:hypothetical protein